MFCQKALKPARLRTAVEGARNACRISQHRVCKLLELARSTCRYKSISDEQAALRMRLKKLAATCVRYGYRRLHILLRCEGWRANAKHVYRLYRAENLSLHAKTPKRRVSCRKRAERPEATCMNDCWAMDFMHDELFDGRRIRLLTTVDLYTRESLAIVVRQRFPARKVAEILDRLET